MEAFFALILMFISQFFGIDLGGVGTPRSENVPVEEYAQVVRVVDGDTITVTLQGVEETVRYIGIDTPEPYRDGESACYSNEASNRNRELVAEREVRMVPGEENRDRYNRLLRYVYVDETFVNQALLDEGYATTLTIQPNTRFASEFKTAEADARAAGHGLWSACADTQSAVPDPEITTAAVIDAEQLSPGQQQMLDFLGIDASVFEVTAEMVICANAAVGVGRLAEITAGDAPSITEGIKLIRCYRS